MEASHLLSWCCNFQGFVMKIPFLVGGWLLAGAATLWPQAGAAQAAVPVVLTGATAPAGLRPALERDENALADPVREALRTLPQAKKKFLAGLPIGDQFLLSVRIVATDTSFRKASARVLGWHGNTVQALLLGLLQDRHDAVLVDGADGGRSHFQGHPSVLLGDVKTLFLQVRIELALGLVIGVRNVVANAGTLAGQITNTGHDIGGLINYKAGKRAANIGKSLVFTKHLGLISGQMRPERLV